MHHKVAADERSPSKSLAVVLDVGTNNEDLRKDDLYIVRLDCG